MINKILIRTSDRKTLHKDRRSLGMNGENLQEVLLFCLDEKIEGNGIVEVELPDGTKGMIEVDRTEEGYELPVKSSLLTQTGFVKFQLRILHDDVEIFKSEIIALEVKDSINATASIPEEYPSWVDVLENLKHDLEKAESERVSNEKERQSAEKTRQENFTKMQETVSSAVSNIKDLTEGYNSNAEKETKKFNDNAVEQTKTFNDNSDSKLAEYDKNHTDKMKEYDSDAIAKLDAYNENDTDKTNAYNANDIAKTKAYNDNTVLKEKAYNDNAADKVKEYNTNVEQKETEFEDLAEEKINEYNTNHINKTKEFNNIISPNLYNPTDAKQNVAISQGDGTETSFDGWLATGYIKVGNGDILFFSNNDEPFPYSTGAFYDSNKNCVSAFGNPNNNNNNITITADGYARFSFNNTPDKLQIEKNERTPYIPFGELVISKDVAEIQEKVTQIQNDITKTQEDVAKIQEDHSNLFNKDTVVKGAVFAESGYFDSSFSSWETSDYIPVKPGMILYFSSNELPIGVVSTGAYYDANKKYLSGVNNEPTVLTVPEGAYYLRFSKNGGLGDTLNTLKIERYGITKYTPYGESYILINESALPSSILPKWKGLKILTLGDSITAMGGVNGWTYWIKEYLLADKVVNVSVAGSTWQDKVANQTYDGNPQPSTDGNVMGNQVQKVLNAKANGDADYQDFDVITFSFGTNDSVDFSVQTKESVESQFITNYAQNNFTVVPLESVNRQTLAGAMRYGFQKLHEAYPDAVIFMCTPTQECYETFDSIYQKGDFINYVADRLGVETIDTRRCGIRNIYESQTTIDYDHPEQSGSAPIQTDLLDGIHTNENGAKKIAKYNAREIIKYFMIN